MPSRWRRLDTDGSAAWLRDDQGVTSSIRSPAAGVDEVGLRRLGGLDQWVMIRGADTANPPLILLHGGPGMSETGFFRRYLAALERSFTLVYWDQRGAGRSFDRDIPRASMTTGRFLADLDELVDQVRDRLEADRVAILGHSWGSALGVLYASRFPEKVSTYVGTGQIGDWPAAEAASYEYALKAAERAGKRRMAKKLRAIGAPPYDAAAVFTQRTCLSRLEGRMTPRALLTTFRDLLGDGQASLLDLPKNWRAFRFTMDAMWAEVSGLDLAQEAPDLRVPVYFLLGRNDHWVPPRTSVAYFEALEAPVKELVWFERSGHEPFIDESAKFNSVMVDSVRPTL
jgi:pimeloyl-ACP methyl ester carboxylesterase